MTDYLPTKFEPLRHQLCKVWETERWTDIPTNTCKAICPSFFKEGGVKYYFKPHYCTVLPRTSLMRSEVKLTDRQMGRLMNNRSTDLELMICFGGATTVKYSKTLIICMTLFREAITHDLFTILYFHNSSYLLL